MYILQSDSWIWYTWMVEAQTIYLAILGVERSFTILTLHYVVLMGGSYRHAYDSQHSLIAGK